MMPALQTDARRLIAELGSRGITVQVIGDLLEVTPKSLLTNDDRVQIRLLKSSLIACLAPCVSHVDPNVWTRQPLADRPGWERAMCRRCGKFIGFNPIRGDATQKTVLRSSGGDGGDGGDETSHPRSGSEERHRAAERNQIELREAHT